MKKYSKMIMQIVGTLLAAFAAVVTGGVTTNEWINIAIIGVGAASVFAGPNVPGAAYTKVILSALMAVLTLLSSLILGGLTTPETIQIILAALTALGVYQIPNAAGVVDHGVRA